MSITTQVAGGNIVLYDGKNVVALSPEAVCAINQTVRSEEPAFMQSNMEKPWELAGYCNLGDEVENSEKLQMFPGYDAYSETWNVHLLVRGGTMDVPFGKFESIATEIAEPMLGPDI